MDKTTDNIGSRIKFLREQKGYSQVKLAEITGIRQSYLSEIELGKRNIRSDTLNRIYAALDISPNQPLPHGVHKVPVAGIVSAGEGIFSEREVGETLLAFNNNVDFAVKVQGDSLIDWHICPGDYLGVSNEFEVKSGDIAVIEIGGDHQKFVKKVFIREKEVILKSGNCKYLDMPFPKHRVKQMRKVMDLYRERMK